MELQNSMMSEIQSKLKQIEKVKQEIGKVIIGQYSMIEEMLVGLLSDGHILLEGVPGVAKTLAAKTLAKTLSCEFKRIQFTPDLLPADLTGTSIYLPENRSFSIKKGPIFTQFLLADEINRAPAKVQSALLEIMQEKQVTISGETFKIDEPFFVIATQNPLEQEGTYPLSEAQIDRFMLKIKVNYPSKEEEKAILNRAHYQKAQEETSEVLSIQDLIELRHVVEQIYIDEKVMDYILSITLATRNLQNFQDSLSEWIEYGVSPRASLALKIGAKALAFLKGRYFVTPQDVKTICYPVLRHRLKLSYEGLAENLTTDDFINRLLEQLPVP